MAVTALSLLTVKVRPAGGPEIREISLANIPNRGNGLARQVLRELLRRYPEDCVLTQDFESFRISDLLAPPPADEGVLPDFQRPDPDKPRYERLVARMKTGGGLEPVGIANIPASQAGHRLVRDLIDKFPDGLFCTTDFGMLRLGDIDKRSLAELNALQD